MYSDLFCRIYDTLGWNAYPEELAEQIRRDTEETRTWFRELREEEQP